jgi:hypothetical protein
MQVKPGPQTPQLPPQPSSPHAFPAQVGWHTASQGAMQR